MPTVRVSTKGQIVIPAQFRKELGIQPGTWLAMQREGGTIRLSVLGDDLIKATRGMLTGDAPPLTQELLKERARDRQREEAKAGSRPQHGRRGPPTALARVRSCTGEMRGRDTHFAYGNVACLDLDRGLDSAPSQIRREMSDRVPVFRPWVHA